MKKRMFIAVGALILVFSGIFGYRMAMSYFMGQYFASFAQPPATVSTEQARRETWQPRLAAVGELTAVRGVDLSNELAGTVERIQFESGQPVARGELLVQLDDSTEQARLPGLEARASLARINLERTQRLIERKLTAAENLDTVKSELQQAESQLAELKATIAKKAIRAPFDGVLGIRRINEGQYLPAGTPIVTLQSLDSLYADFNLPERFLDRLEVGQPVRVRVSAWPEAAFDGEINAVSVKVDPSSHNVAVQALVNNPEHRLRPGMFADVEVLAGAPETLVAIPKPAVSYSLYGDMVYVVRDEGTDDQGRPRLTAHQRFVKLGRANGEWVAVVEGLEAGEQVITAGQIKLSDGARVTINNDVAVVPEPPAAAGGDPAASY